MRSLRAGLDRTGAKSKGGEETGYGLIGVEGDKGVRLGGNCWKNLCPLQHASLQCAWNGTQDYWVLPYLCCQQISFAIKVGISSPSSAGPHKSWWPTTAISYCLSSNGRSLCGGSKNFSPVDDPADIIVISTIEKSIRKLIILFYEQALNTVQ